MNSFIACSVFIYLSPVIVASQVWAYLSCKTNRMQTDWKPTIIRWTEMPEARAKKIDSTFFPPVSEAELSRWEAEHSVILPEVWRSYMLISNGLEAMRGELWPILPIEDWQVTSDGWVAVGQSLTHCYHLQAKEPGQVRQVANGDDNSSTVFADGLEAYLQLTFRGMS